MPDAAQFPHDLFISHATEDKDGFVRPLAAILRGLGVNLWYDEFSLSIGDSLTDSVNVGLASSQFGLVVISPAFMNKNWAAQELRGLATRQITEGRVILPVWLGVTASEVQSFNLMLADLLAIRTDGSDPADIAFQILKIVRPDIYERTSRQSKIAEAEASALLAELGTQLKRKIERNLPTNGRGEITAATMRDVLFDIVDFALAARKTAT